MHDSEITVNVKVFYCTESIIIRTLATSCIEKDNIKDLASVIFNGKTDFCLSMYSYMNNRYPVRYIHMYE